MCWKWATASGRCGRGEGVIFRPAPEKTPTLTLVSPALQRARRSRFWARLMPGIRAHAPRQDQLLHGAISLVNRRVGARMPLHPSWRW